MEQSSGYDGELYLVRLTPEEVLYSARNVRVIIFSSKQIFKLFLIQLTKKIQHLCSSTLFGLRGRLNLFIANIRLSNEFVSDFILSGHIYVYIIVVRSHFILFYSSTVICIRNLRTHERK